MLTLVLVVLVGLVLAILMHSRLLVDQEYYDPTTTYPALSGIHSLRHKILSELDNNHNVSDWVDWPERNLYRGVRTTWRVFPLNVFGQWAEPQCAQLPTLSGWLKTVPGVRMALLSRMTDGSRLRTHQGWAGHSNHVLRCHYGLDVPEQGAWVTVNNQDRRHLNDQWLVFDDSKEHSACNLNGTGRDRLVLIVDLERPWWVKRGASRVQETQELIAVVRAFREGLTIQSSTTS